jgi:hypothetical protein
MLQSAYRGAKTDAHVDAVDERMNPRSSFTPLTGNEYDTAIALLVEAGFDPGEFVLEEQRFEAQAGSRVPHVSKLVSVIRLVVGLHRRYTAGNAGTWPSEFERDLRCGTYGDPAITAANHGTHSPPPRSW